MSALTFLPVLARMPVKRARLAVGAILAANIELPTSNTERRTQELAAAAFERDMQGVRIALVEALQLGGMEAMQTLRSVWPQIVEQTLARTALADALLRAMLLEFFAAIKAEDDALKARLADLDETPQVTDALAEFRRRQIFETDLGSAELRGFSSQLRNRSLFSARTTSADYLQEVQTVVDEILAGKENMATGRWRLMKKLKQLGYDPAVGFPSDMANVPPADRGSLQDLSSAQRIDLVLETNVRMARGYAQAVAGNRPADVAARPAWELKRLYLRDVPRGTPESHSVGWQRRWSDAAEAVNHEGVAREGGRMVALKSSPIWAALGDGAGGYTDTLLNPFPPFAFRSGYGWAAVSRAEAKALGLNIQRPTSNIERPMAEPAAPAPSLTPGQKEVKGVFARLGETIKNTLRRVLGL